MKLTEVLEGIGRPVAYYPGLRKITGSTTATILLCQLFYWTGKEASGDGWIYKTSEELEVETGLSYDEQFTARQHLVARKLLEENYKRLEHKMYFRVCMEQINSVWEIPETGIAKMGNGGLPSSLNRTTETTTETIKPADIPERRTQAQVKGDLVDGAIELAMMPGAKKAVRLLAIESIIKVTLNVNPGKRWHDFIEYVDDRQQKDGQHITVFLNWLISQPGFDISFWPPAKLQENWPRAFAKSYVQQDEPAPRKTDDQPGAYVPAPPRVAAAIAAMAGD